MNRKQGEMLSEREWQFLAHCRVAHLATADGHAVPHVAPICFVVRGNTLYFAIDEKPKRRPMLKRLQNIAENPMVAVVADRYDEDWTRLGWVMLRGRAEILDHGIEHDEAQVMLRARYHQLEAMQIAGNPVIAVRIERATSWGSISGWREPDEKPC